MNCVSFHIHEIFSYEQLNIHVHALRKMINDFGIFSTSAEVSNFTNKTICEVAGFFRLLKPPLITILFYFAFSVFSTNV